MNSTSSTSADQLLDAPQYSLRCAEKWALLVPELARLTEHHRTRCAAYDRIVRCLAAEAALPPTSLAAIPLLPARLFKTLELRSVPAEDVVRTLTSSGTTSQQPSRIALDRATATLQTRALAAVVSAFLGSKRRPMIIVDSREVMRARGELAARGAAIVGFSSFGRDPFFALDDHGQLDLAGLETYLQRHAGESIFVFGFTFLVWQHLYRELQRRGARLPLHAAVLIHGGGWKKLADQSVDNRRFKDALAEQLGIERVHDYYGMVEQVGGVYMECEHGFLHSPNVADVLIRRAHDWSVADLGETGLIQTASVLPRSYPGHSILTEDLGQILGVDDCPCGRYGTRFVVRGRAARAELRGCSDVHASRAEPAPEARDATVLQLIPHRATAPAVEALCTPGFLARRPMTPFDPLIVEFLDAVGEELRRLPDVQMRPDLLALAFWLRRSHVHAMARRFEQSLSPDEIVQPVGLVFHVTPSNVDVMFLYSWAIALLAGNANVVRISREIPPHVAAICDAISRLLESSPLAPIRERNVVLTYDHDDRTSGWLSQVANARVIWGGDQTVQRIRALPARPTTRDVAFADKLSSCVVNAARYLALTTEARGPIAHAFRNDAYLFDQLACSSPQTVYFVGSLAECESASRAFWSALAAELLQRPAPERPALLMDQRVKVAELAARSGTTSWISGRRATEPVVVRARLEELAACRDRVGGGFFVEAFLTELAQLEELVQPDDQTLGYVGFTRDEMLHAARTFTTHGVDRVVPMGQALAFGPTWDGYVLLSELTRRVVIA